MVDFRAVTRDHVLTAIEEYDAAGGDLVLAIHGRPDSTHLLRHAGRQYDAKVVAGLAYMSATRAAASPDELFTGRNNAGEVLADLGFDLTLPAPPPAPEPRVRRSAPPATRPRSSGVRSSGVPLTSKRPVRAEEPVAKICPTCFLALPATGVCDNCD